MDILSDKSTIFCQHMYHLGLLVLDILIYVWPMKDYYWQSYGQFAHFKVRVRRKTSQMERWSWFFVFYCYSSFAHFRVVRSLKQNKTKQTNKPSLPPHNTTHNEQTNKKLAWQFFYCGANYIINWGGFWLCFWGICTHTAVFGSLQSSERFVLSMNTIKHIEEIEPFPSFFYFLLHKQSTLL